MKTQKEIKTIATFGTFRVEQWRDGSTNWRAGFNWFEEDDCEFVCEKQTFNEAVQLVFKYVLHHYIKKSDKPFEI